MSINWQKRTWAAPFHTLDLACRREPESGADKKLAVIRAAARSAYPSADIDQMLAEIESGYGAGPRP